MMNRRNTLFSISLLGLAGWIDILSTTLLFSLLIVYFPFCFDLYTFLLLGFCALGFISGFTALIVAGNKSRVFRMRLFLLIGCLYNILAFLSLFSPMLESLFLAQFLFLAMAAIFAFYVINLKPALTLRSTRTQP